MELFEHRVINGLMREVDTVRDPAQAEKLLSIDSVIDVPTHRASDDLWPAVWALASVLLRQFSGAVHINCDLPELPASPADLGPRCSLGAGPEGALHIALGQSSDSTVLWGDARGGQVAVGELLPIVGAAHPTACFALAGYLGFAALARAAGIPPNREESVQPSILLPIPEARARTIPDLTVIGLGHLGQAYLALLFFLLKDRDLPHIVLVDKDSFEKENYTTQVLLEEGGSWIGGRKDEVLERHLKARGLSVQGELHELTWIWQRPPSHPRIALLGLDNLDVRRMAIAAGYDWFIEAGLGRSFLRPRVTWHALPCDNELAKRMFHGASHARWLSSKPFLTALQETPGRCGFLRFESIQAAAPSMGLVAAGLVAAELEQYATGSNRTVRGMGMIWSPILPLLRDVLP